MNSKKTVCAILAASMLTTGIVLTQSTASAQTSSVDVSAAKTDTVTTGAAANISDGNKE